MAFELKEPDNETKMLGELLELFMLSKFGAPAKSFLLIYDLGEGDKAAILSNASAETRLRMAAQYIREEHSRGTHVEGVQVINLAEKKGESDVN